MFDIIDVFQTNQTMEVGNKITGCLELLISDKLAYECLKGCILAKLKTQSNKEKCKKRKGTEKLNLQSRKKLNFFLSMDKLNNKTLISCLLFVLL